MTPESYEELRPTLNTGDLVLFKGFGIFFFLKMSHVAMVFRNDQTDQVMLWEAIVSGVSITPARQRMVGYKGRMWLKRMTPPADAEALRGFGQAVRALWGRPYERKWWRLLRAVIPGPGWMGGSNDRTLFCSETVIRTLQYMGLEPPDAHWNPEKFTPWDVSSLHYLRSPHKYTAIQQV